MRLPGSLLVTVGGKREAALAGMLRPDEAKMLGDLKTIDDLRRRPRRSLESSLPGVTVSQLRSARWSDGTDPSDNDGAVLIIEEIVAREIFPFTGDLQVKPLEARVVPEPLRHDTDPAECGSCGRPDSEFIWTDEHWRVQAMLPTPVPGVVLLNTRVHQDSFTDMTAELLGELGPMIARMERAVEPIGEVGRVHLNRWGDGGGHFHLWSIPRPLGALQLRGSCLPMWFDVLPDLDDEAAEAHPHAIAGP